MSVIDLDQRRPADPTPVGFNPESYRLSVTDVRQYKDPATVREGTLWFDEWSIKDSATDITTRYRKITGVPSHQISDVSVTVATPWLTTEEGHNLRTLVRYMGVGLPGSIVGPPRLWIPGSNLASSIQATKEAATHVELGKDAKALLLILAAQDDTGKHKGIIAPGESFYHGESRGAMLGFALLSLAKEQDWTFHAPELIDPCLADETTVIDLAKLENLPKIASEVGTLFSLFGNILLEKRRRHYHKTLDFSLEYLIPAVATWNALSNGQTGKMAESVPLDSVADITFCTASVANQEDRYREILHDHSGIDFFEQNGGHLALAKRFALFHSMGRILTANQQLIEHGSITDLRAVRQALPIAC